MKKLSRAELYKDVKRILVRHLISTTTVSVNVTYTNLELQGELIKMNGEELTISQVFSLVQELTQRFHLTTRLENWDLNGGQIIKKEVLLEDAY